MDKKQGFTNNNFQGNFSRAHRFNNKKSTFYLCLAVDRNGMGYVGYLWKKRVVNRKRAKQ